MPLSFVSEPLIPAEASFDTARMSCGEPGVPRSFRWGKRELEVAEVLEHWKEYGDCKHGSGERYVRKHVYLLKTTGGGTIKVYFQRSFGRAKGRSAPRWWLLGIEDNRDAVST